MQKCLAALLLLCSLAVVAQKKAVFSLPPRTSGPKTAPLVLDVFTDFECGHCREYYLRTLTRVMEDYCAKGKVYLVHHEYPLRGHILAPEAAKWALAASTIGKYEDVTEALFEKQPEWTQSRNIEGVVASAVTPAEMTKIKQVMADHGAELESAIQADVFQGNLLNINQTPTSKLTYKGKSVYIPPDAGNISYAILKRMFDEQLAK